MSLRYRVFNPTIVSEFRCPSTPVNDTAVARVRKSLFGPVNHEDRREFVDRELASLSKRDMEKWEFDFIKEKPLNTPSSRFVWERVVPQEAVPEAYALKRLPYLGIANTTTTSNTSSSSSSCTRENTNITLSSDGKMPSSTSITGRSRPHQTTITDFMKTKKRPSASSDQQTKSSTSEPSSDPSIVKKMRTSVTTTSTTSLSTS